jgi:thiol:disulfide interchange protein
MKTIKLLIPALLLAFTSMAQNQAQEVAAPYKAHNEGWLVNMDEAFALSEKTGKPIMANFTGSDWCGWCIRLTNDVFNKPEFKQWAEKNVVLLEVDFPRRKVLPDEIRQQNTSLQQAFNVVGYPTVWVFNLKRDPEKNHFSIEALGSTGYMQDVNAFTSGVENMIKQQGKK